MPNTRGKAKRDLLRAEHDIEKAMLQIAWQVQTFGDLPNYTTPLEAGLHSMQETRDFLKALEANFDRLTTPTPQA